MFAMLPPISDAAAVLLFLSDACSAGDELDKPLNNVKTKNQRNR